MQFLIDIYQIIFDEVEKQLPTSESLENIAVWGNTKIPHSDWAKLASVRVDEDVNVFREWIDDELVHAQDMYPFEALFFGLSEYQDRYGRLFSNAYLNTYTSITEPWPFSEKRQGSKNNSNSSILKTIGTTCNKRTKGIGAEAYAGLSIAYMSLLVSELKSNPKIIESSHQKPIKMGVGFSSGDILEIMSIEKGRCKFERKYA